MDRAENIAHTFDFSFTVERIIPSFKVSEQFTDRINDLIKNTAFYDGEHDMSFKTEQ